MDYTERNYGAIEVIFSKSVHRSITGNYKRMI